MQNKLIIFIKNPELGKVKTRLAADVGDATALEVYQKLLSRCRQECSKVDAQRFLFYAEFIDEQDSWSANLFHKKVQDQGDLGDRIKGAFQEVAQEGTPTMIIGSDCYDLDASKIEAAFEALEQHDLVIGPANDGGYYLLGSRQYYPSLFENIPWSTDTVFTKTIAAAKELELSVAVLEELVDLDTLEDVEKSSFPWTKK